MQNQNKISDTTATSPSKPEFSEESQVATFTRSLRAVFHGLDQETVKQLRTFGVARGFKAGETIIQQGILGDTFYVLVEGRVAITQTSLNEEITLGIVTPGKYFGEMALLEDVARTATCIAMTDVQTLEISRLAFDEIMIAQPKLAYNVMFQVLSNMRRNESNALNRLVTKAEELELANKKLTLAQQELVKAERFKREIEIAGEVQRSLLPSSLPQYEGIEFAAWLGATRAGGDFYDVIELDDDHVGILLGDVGNLGIQASVYMAMVRTLFRVECRRSLNPLTVAMAVHKGILDVTTVSDMYVNVFYGVLHRPSGMFSYVVAGQEQPLLYRPGQGIAQLKGRGNFLGLAPSITLNEKRTRVKVGDRLILISDGIFGATNPEGDVFTQEKLIEIIKREKGQNAEELLTRIVVELEQWTNNSDPYANNDLALLVMHVAGAAPPTV